MKAVWAMFLSVVSLLLIVIMKFGFIFLLLALIPSIAAYFSDRDPNKTSFKIVLAGNLGAALPTLLPMLEASVKRRHYDVESIIGDPKIWLFIYLGAGAGWGLIFLCRYIASFIVAVTFEYNIKALEREQKLIVEEWGTNVRRSPSPITTDNQEDNQ